MPARALLGAGMALALTACPANPADLPQLHVEYTQVGIWAYGAGSTGYGSLKVENLGPDGQGYDGDHDLYLTSVTTAAPFRVTQYDPRIRGFPGFVWVDFRPPALGEYSADLVIESNAQNTPHLVIKLQGHCVDAGS